MKSVKRIATLSLVGAATTSTAMAAEKPNIVLFLVDDMGWLDSAVAYGEEQYPSNLRYETPNMVRLAEAGVIMTSAYACPVSTPTRTSIMSGMNAAHTRITNWTSPLKNVPSDATGGAVNMDKPGGRADLSQEKFSRPEWNLNGLSPVADVENTVHATPFPQLLRDAGYFTIHVGKAHWASAGTPGANPYNMGFVVNVSGQMNGAPTSYYSEDHYGNKPGRWNYMSVQNMAEYYNTGTHLTEAVTLEALKALEYPVSKRQPFFLYMAHYATHTPIQRDPRFVQKYLDRGYDEGQARYASMIEGVDKSLGDLLNYLEERNIARNTIVIFMTDNGGNAENKSKGGVRHHLNAPLRSGKGSCYEGGIRVPLICSWPSRVVAGTRVNTPTMPEDLYPTILDMAGVKWQGRQVQEVDGQSLVALMTKGSKMADKAAKRGEITNQKEATHFVVPQSVSGIDPERYVLFHYPHKWKAYDLADIDYLSSIRKGEWKLVYRMATGELELYNLNDDIGEQHNLASQHPERVRALASALGERLRRWNAPMPVVNATGQAVAMPDEL